MIRPPHARFPSWTTVDATAKYLFNSEHGPLADASVLLSVTNLLNKAPPFVPNPVFGINFDGANANALGPLPVGTALEAVVDARRT